jgi:hypothetical protein
MYRMNRASSRAASSKQYILLHPSCPTAGEQDENVASAVMRRALLARSRLQEATQVQEASETTGSWTPQLEA